MSTRWQPRSSPSPASTCSPVDISIGEPAGELQRETRRNENGRPVRTVARLGACAVDCTWQPGVDAGPDTTEIIEGLSAAVVCSLAGVAATRAQRDEVTQLGDGAAVASPGVAGPSGPAGGDRRVMVGGESPLSTGSCLGVWRGARASPTPRP